MADEAILSLRETLRGLLKQFHHPDIKREIIYIGYQSYVMRDRPKNNSEDLEEQIKEAAATTKEMIEYFLSRDNPLYDGLTRPTEEHLQQLKDVAEYIKSTVQNLKSTSGDAAESVNASLKDIYPSTTATRSKDVIVGVHGDLRDIKYLINCYGESWLQDLSILRIEGINKPSHRQLQVLSIAGTGGIGKLRNCACSGTIWQTAEGEFQQLEFLLVEESNLYGWWTERSHFPNLKSLVFHCCPHLRGIPNDIGYISTLELITVDSGNKSLVYSANMIQKDQERRRNNKIRVRYSKPFRKRVCYSNDFFTQQRELIPAANYLPYHLNECFLYMAAFPKYYEIRASEIIKLWVAEGFVTSQTETRSLEEEAEDYLNDLVQRRLVLVTSWKTDGKIKTFRLHQRVREFCIMDAVERKFILPIRDNIASTRTVRRNTQRVSCCLYDLKDLKHSSSTQTVIGIIEAPIRVIDLMRVEPEASVRDFTSLEVLHVLRRDDRRNCPYLKVGGVFDHVHLTYLASCLPSNIVPSAISKLQSLQTLIIYNYSVNLPKEIWRMSQLRHLMAFSFCPLPNPEDANLPLKNLHTLSLVTDFKCSRRMVVMIPNIKKLGIVYSGDHHLYNVSQLLHLEKLKVEMPRSKLFRASLPVFPRWLKKLNLSGGGLPWRNMTIIGSLPNLQVLKLRNYGCHGKEWMTTVGDFRELRFLLIDGSDLWHWKTESRHLPRLQRLILHRCPYLPEIPSEIGGILTLELIEVDDHKLWDSAKRIERKLLEYGARNIEVRVCLWNSAPHQTIGEAEDRRLYYERIREVCTKVGEPDLRPHKIAALKVPSLQHYAAEAGVLRLYYKRIGEMCTMFGELDIHPYEIFKIFVKVWDFRRSVDEITEKVIRSIADFVHEGEDAEASKICNRPEVPRLRQKLKLESKVSATLAFLQLFVTSDKLGIHLERKLRKNQVADTDIGVSVDSILFPDVPIALRLSSHLLLGVVRIYNRKVNYLFDDCSEALLKVKQAFRSTAVDLPPEEAKAPYHSITLPEKFDLDDFELPDNDIFQGNYVDHHVSSRDQITLQDTMEGVSYSTSKFGLDERFGDADMSGLDLEEELLLGEIGTAENANERVDPQASFGSTSTLKQDQHAEDRFADSEAMVDGGDECTDVMDYAQGPRTPGLMDEPNFSKVQEASACEDMDKAPYEDKQEVDWFSQNDKISDTLTDGPPEEKGYLSGELEFKESEPQGQIESTKPTSECTNEIIKGSDVPNHTEAVNKDKNDLVSVDEAHSHDHESNEVGLEVSKAVSELASEDQDGHILGDTETQACQGTIDSRENLGGAHDKEAAGETIVLRPCNSFQDHTDVEKPAMCPSNDEDVKSDICVEATDGGGETEKLGQVHCVNENSEVNLKENQVSHHESGEDILVAAGKADGLTHATAELPAPEKLLSVPEGHMDMHRCLMMEVSPGDFEGLDEGDAGSKTAAGRKRTFTESTLTEQSLNSVESSRQVRVKRTTGSVPDDDDLLSSILVGRNSSILRVKPTPPPYEVTSMKRSRAAPRPGAPKRKVFMDDTMVLHGDAIRQQLINAEDIRRVRKKAPCTLTEISLIQKKHMDGETFLEPIFTGMSTELTSLHGQVYDLGRIKVGQNVHDASLKIVSELGLPSQNDENGNFPETMIEPNMGSWSEKSGTGLETVVELQSTSPNNRSLDMEDNEGPGKTDTIEVSAQVLNDEFLTVRDNETAEPCENHLPGEHKIEEVDHTSIAVNEQLKPTTDEGTEDSHMEHMMNAYTSNAVHASDGIIQSASVNEFEGTDAHVNTDAAVISIRLKLRPQQNWSLWVLIMNKQLGARLKLILDQMIIICQT